VQNIYEEHVYLVNGKQIVYIIFNRKTKSSWSLLVRSRWLHHMDLYTLSAGHMTGCSGTHH